MGAPLTAGNLKCYHPYEKKGKWLEPKRKEVTVAHQHIETLTKIGAVRRKRKNGPLQNTYAARKISVARRLGWKKRRELKGVCLP